MFQFGDLARREAEDVGDDPHRAARRIDIGAARHVLLEHVVLDRAVEPAPRHAALLRDDQIERQQDRRGGVDRHRGGNLVERQSVEQRLHVGERADRHAHAPDFSLPPADGPSRGPSGSADRRRPRARSAPARTDSDSGGWIRRAVPNPAYWRIVHSRPRYIVGCTPRVKGYSPGKPELGEVVGSIARPDRRGAPPRFRNWWRSARAARRRV